MRYQIERPVNDYCCHTYRSLDPEHITNQGIDFSTSNIGLEKVKELLDEVIIRFDTSPDFYTKEDYMQLIRLFKGIFNYLIQDLKYFPFKGALLDTHTDPLSENIPGSYIVTIAGVYKNFKDENDAAIEITEFDLNENIILLNPSLKDSKIIYEKINIPLLIKELEVENILNILKP